MSIEVLAAGLATTVQDGGRRGWRRFGVGGAGAADPWSLAVANRLVGNPASTALLEITLAGPRLRFRRPARIALAGATIEAHCDGIELPGWHRIDLPADAELRLGGCRRGARAYLAVAGGIEVEPVMQSRSTDLRGGFGGFEGRALRTGDRLALGEARIDAVSVPHIDPRWADPRPALDFDHPPLLRVLPGADPTRPADALFAAPWEVDANSDRQGLRLRGPALTLAADLERPSEPVLPGTVQLPPNGQPIVLGADAQTVGGYPRIGHVIRADWPRLAQLRPGDSVHLQPVDTATAAAVWRVQCEALARLAIALGAPST